MAEVIQRNARGGIDKLSNREALGARPQGATGTGQSFAIPVTKLQPATPAQIPPPPLPEDPGNLVGANNTAIAPTLAPHGFTLDANGQFAYTPPKETTDSTSGYDKIFSQYLGLQEAPTSTADIYASEANAAGLTDKRNAVSRLTGRLNSIVAKNQADQLRLEQANSSNDVTKGVFNAQVARLNREAAIAALPVQAQLAAAQGDYEMAQQHVDKMYQIKIQDALAQYQWKNKVLDSVYSFANAQEQRRLDDLKVKEDRKYTEQQDFLKTQRSLLSSALQQGAPSSVISAIGEATTVLDVLTAAGQYNGDVLARQIQQAQLRKLNSDIVTPTDGASPLTSAIINNPSLFNDLTPTERGNVIAELQANGYDTSNLGTKSLSDTAIKQIADTQKALDDLANLKTIISENSALLGPVTGLQALNPWNPARKIQADVDRVRQTVGKALEGGVLRKEDEEKYKKILATLTDTPDTAEYKIDALVTSIQRDIETYKNLQLQSGRSLNVGASLPKEGDVDVNSLRAKYGY